MSGFVCVCMCVCFYFILFFYFFFFFFFFGGGGITAIGSLSFYISPETLLIATSIFTYRHIPITPYWVLLFKPLLCKPSTQDSNSQMSCMYPVDQSGSESRSAASLKLLGFSKVAQTLFTVLKW